MRGLESETFLVKYRALCHHQSSFLSAWQKREKVSVDEQSVHLPAPVSLWLVLTHSTFTPNSAMLDSLGSPPQAQLNLKQLWFTRCPEFTPAWCASAPAPSVPLWALWDYRCLCSLIDWLYSHLVCPFFSLQGHLHVIWHLNFNGLGGSGKSTCIIVISLLLSLYDTAL